MARSGLRPVTSAALTVVPWGDRAGIHKAWNGTRDREEGEHGALGSLADTDLVIGLRLGGGPAEPPAWAASVVVAERARYLAAPASLRGARAPAQERLMVIDRLWLADGVAHWRPPVGALLMATAAMIVATVGHDGSARTCVACRVDQGDSSAAEAAAALGARPLDRDMPAAEPRIWPGIARLDDLRFLDESAAGRAAAAVLCHLDQACVPSRLLPIGDVAGRRIEGIMALSFPRVVTALREEIADIAAGKMALDWRAPAVPLNDLDRYLRAAALPAGA